MIVVVIKQTNRQTCIDMHSMANSTLLFGNCLNKVSAPKANIPAPARVIVTTKCEPVSGARMAVLVSSEITENPQTCNVLPQSIKRPSGTSILRDGSHPIVNPSKTAHPLARIKATKQYISKALPPHGDYTSPRTESARRIRAIYSSEVFGTSGYASGSRTPLLSGSLMHPL